MTTLNIQKPERLRVDIKLPASKSISNRALIIHALSGGATLPDNLSDCDDTEVIIRALQQMPEIIDIKAAGTAMRFMTAFLSATPNGTHVLTGTDRMKHRPIKVLVDALRHLGADITYEGEAGYPPLRINGQRLEGGELEIAGNVSSQYISALLLVGPVLRKGLTLRLTGEIISRPYIDLTLWTMREFGADAEWTSVDTITVEPKPYVERSYYIENDWSAASYWYEMVALSDDPEAEVQLEGLMDGSKQGDSGVRYLFSLLGVKTSFASRQPGKPTTVTLRKSNNRVARLDYDFNNMPDLAQTFVCTCCVLGLPFHFTGLQTLKIKETDRIEALKTELAKLGYTLEDRNGSELLWDGTRSEALGQRTLATEGTQEVGAKYDASIDTYEDHRMALAFAPLAMKMPISINNPQVVTKSYPHFWDDLRKAGFTIND
ncbi:MAG: 3-phosphoshikimate 1-carboxyvinyltransferase [Prevotella sp.]|nr:3-phosphoshikimate 1-carboxyvinyltransferase [Prevotella sp.]